MVSLQNGDLMLWDDENREDVSPTDISYGLEDVIKEIWDTLDI